MVQSWNTTCQARVARPDRSFILVKQSMTGSTARGRLRTEHLTSFKARLFAGACKSQHPCVSDHKHSFQFPGRARNNPQVLTVVPSLKVFRLTQSCQHRCCGNACWNLVYPLPIIVTKVQRHEHLSHPSCSDMTPRHHVTQIFISLSFARFAHTTC